MIFSLCTEEETIPHNVTKQRISAIPADTSPEAFRKQIAALRRLGISGRAQMTFELSDSLRATVEAGVRHRHPDYDDESVRMAVLRLMIGEEQFRAAFPRCRVKS